MQLTSILALSLAAIASAKQTLSPYGCFKDFKDASGPTEQKYLSAGLCQTKCQGHAAIGLKNGTECHCADEKPKVESHDCEIKCPGFPGDYCGGPETYTVYLIKDSN